MRIGIPREVLEQEARVAATPETVRAYRELGFEVAVESGAGAGIFQGDEEYVRAGARIESDARALWRDADLIVKVKQPHAHPAGHGHEAEMIREKGILIAFLHPAAPSNHDMVRRLARRGVTSFTMDSIPRISRAQAMDALTAMSTVTGYKGILMAADRYPRFIPMMSTAVGTAKPARFLIVGCGVVGLQAIATARRLGGSVAAFDIRADARRAAESLGAKVAGFEVPEEIAIGPDGGARALPREWLERERAALEPLVAESDIVVTSALVAGEKAPLLISERAVAGMKPGSVILDVAIDQGGNCEVTQGGAERMVRGVRVLGWWNIPGSMPVHASWLYAHNVLNFVRNLFKEGPGAIDWEDEIVRQTLVTHEGKIVHRGALKAMGEA